MKTRWLGIALLVGSLVVMLNQFRETAASGGNPASDILGSAAYVVWGIGGVCGILGLMQLSALGSNAVARALGFLPLLGFAGFVVADGLKALGLLDSSNALYMTVISVAWLAVLAGMLIVGILTIAAKTWKGWRRFLPLLTVVMLPISFAISAAMDSPYLGAILGYLPWILLGYVIATTESAPALQQSIAA
jgi:hypothetical protein